MAATLADTNLNLQPVCQNCSTSTTPLWRRDENGSVLCNACGLFLKLHGRSRPISLKTDVIKSRNRVKATAQGPRGRKSNGTDSNGSLAASHPDVANIPPNDALSAIRRSSHKFPSTVSDRSNSPTSRTITPLPHHSNIAPQHVFDGVAFSHSAFDSPSLPSFSIRQPSPSAASVNGSALHENGLNGHSGGYEHTNLNNELKTRVTELEVINDLFRGRVDELEKSEQEARQQQAAAREAEKSLRNQLEDALLREQELKRKIDVLESAAATAAAAQASPERRSKRTKVTESTAN